MGVGQAEGLQDALDAAVLSPDSVQGVEADIRGDTDQHLGQVAASIDPGHPGAQAFEGVSAGGTGDQAHLALRGQAAKKDRDVPTGQGAGIRLWHGRTPGEGRAGASRGRRCLSRRGCRSADPADLPLQADPRPGLDVGAHRLAQALEVRRRRLATVDQEVGMLG